jgi:protein-L-isoaspartate(D-aspartate) O-methyltransferase
MPLQRFLQTTLAVVLGAGIELTAGCGGEQYALEARQARDLDSLRKVMVEEQIRSRGVRHEGVLRAMLDVPRHEFVPEAYRSRAYDDSPLPIGLEQTISQPYIVAMMTELVDPKPSHRVLEVGTGSGYQAAVIARLVAQVYSIEIIPELARSSAERLRRLGVNNVQVRQGDGYLGWPEQAPFDGILVTAGATEVPQPLIDQLKPGARMVIPVGSGPDQILKVIEKRPGGRIETREVAPVRFVPLRRQ